MRQLALDPTSNDLALANHSLTLVGTSGAVTPDVLAQKLKIRLGLFLGEYILDGNVGTPWLQQLLGKVSKQVAEGMLRTEITTCPGVASLLSFALTVGNDRQASLSFSVRAITGDVATVTDYRPGGAS